MQSTLPGAVFANIDWTRHIGTPTDLLSTARLGNWLAVGMEASNRRSIEAQTERLVGVLNEQSEQQIHRSRQDARVIAASIQQLSEGQERRFRELGEMLDDRLSLVIDQLHVANALSRDMIALLRLPDSQKQRRHHYEQGLRHYANARFDEGLFAFSLEHLLSAEQLDPTDHRVLMRIGMILLYSPDLCDLSRAEQYLLKASRFANVEIQPGAQVSQDPLEPEQARVIVQDARRHAGEIHHQLSIACLAQKKLADALRWAERAFELHSQSAPIGYQFVRALAANEDPRLYEQTRRLLVQDAAAALALGESSELLNAEPVRRALADHLVTLQAEALQRVDALIGAFSDIPSFLHDLAAEPVREANELIGRYRSAAEQDKAALALQLVRRFNDPDPALKINDETFTIELSSRERINEVVLGSEDTIAILIPSPGSPRNEDGVARAYNWVRTTLLGPPSQRESNIEQAATEYTEPAYGVVYGDNEDLDLLLDRPPRLWPIRRTANRPEALPIKGAQTESDGKWMDLLGRLVKWEKVGKDLYRIVDGTSGEVLVSARCPIRGESSRSFVLLPRRGFVPWGELFPDNRAGLGSVVHVWDAVENRVYDNCMAFKDFDGIVPSADRSQVLICAGGKFEMLDCATGKTSKPAVQPGHIAVPALDRSNQVMSVEANSALGRALTVRYHDSHIVVSVDLRWVAVEQERTVHLYPLLGSGHTPGLLRSLQLAEAARRLNGCLVEDLTSKAVRASGASGAKPVAAKTADEVYAAIRAEIEAIPADAREAHSNAFRLGIHEDRKAFFRRKDYRPALAEYERAKALGYPDLDLKISELRKKVER